MSAALLVLCALLFAFGAVRVFVWILDYQDRQLHAQLAAQQLVADAELDAYVVMLERSWRMPDPTMVAAEARAECLGDATLCEREWSEAAEVNLRG